jgi:hypothetical protein
MVRARIINKTWWLLTIYHFIQVVIEKGILDIELTDRPRAGDSNGEDETDGGRLDNRTEGLIIVEAWTLRVSTNHPASFMASKSSIRVKFVPKDPFTGDHICMRRARNERPGFVVEKSLVLVRHSSTPERVLESLAKSGWNRSDG